MSGVRAHVATQAAVKQNIASALRETGSRAATGPTHSCLIWRAAGPSFPSKQSETPAVSHTSGPRTAGGQTVSSGLLPPHCVLQFRDSAGSSNRGWVWLARLMSTFLCKHTEKGSQINRGLCLGPWVSAGWTTCRADPRELPGSPARSSRDCQGHYNRCPLCAQLNVYHGLYRPGPFYLLA